MSKSHFGQTKLDRLASGAQVESSQHSDQDLSHDIALGDRLRFGIPAAVFLIVTIAISWQNFDGFSLAMVFLLANITIACITQSRIGRFAGSVAGAMIFAISIWLLISMFSLSAPFFTFANLWHIFGKLCFFCLLGLPALYYVLNAKFGFGKFGSSRIK